MRKKINGLLVMIVTASMAISMIGCGKKVASSEKANAMGSFIISVNPEIRVEFDTAGNTTMVEGVNEDGKELMSKMTEIKGEKSQKAVGQIVQKICQNGYFSNKIEGKDRNIIIKIEEGSKLPTDDFAEELADEAKKTADAEGINSSVVVVNNTDLDEDGKISLEKAKEIVLEQLGLESANFINCSYDAQEGVYEMKLEANGLVYEYEVDAFSGKVIESEVEEDNKGNEETETKEDDSDDSEDDSDDSDDSDDDDADDDTDDDDDDDDDDEDDE